MNIHPILVHFPVALLTLYAIMELVRFRKVIDSETWWYMKCFVVVLGTLGSYAAYMAGDPVAELYRQTHTGMGPILRVHELWASITVTVFTLVSLIYMCEYVKRCGYAEKIKSIPVVGALWKVVAGVCEFLNKPSILVTLALSGLVAVTLTGAFGGSLVYGTTGDPFIAFVYKIFIAQ